MTIEDRRDDSPQRHGPYFGAGHAAVLAVTLWLALSVGILWRL